MATRHSEAPRQTRDNLRTARAHRVSASSKSAGRLASREAGVWEGCAVGQAVGRRDGYSNSRHYGFSSIERARGWGRSALEGSRGGSLATKVYFGVKSAYVYQGQMGT